MPLVGPKRGRKPVLDVKEPILGYWYQALHAEHGIELITDDGTQARQKLYAARKEVLDPDLDCISICLSPFEPNNLWLVKKTTKVKSDEA